MKSPEYIVHGTSSEVDAGKIEQEKFKAQEGRATISSDLIYAFEWATQKERRDGSKSETEVSNNESGRIIIMEKPDNKSINYATHTDIEINEQEKEIVGYTSKYESGRKQLAIYNGDDPIERKKQIEQAKDELKNIGEQMKSFLEGNDLDPSKIDSMEHLLIAIKAFDLDKQIKILRGVEELALQIENKRKTAEIDISIEKENILMSIVASVELGEKLRDLSSKIKNLEKVDLDFFAEQVSKIVRENKDNYLSKNIDIKSIISELLKSTIETEIISMMRSLSLDVQRARGFSVYNRERNEIKEKEVNRNELKQRLEKIRTTVFDNNFDTGLESINRYIRINIEKLIKELE